MLNIHQHSYEVTRELRKGLFGHDSVVLWFVGLSGSGKSTIASALEKRLIENKVYSRVLDGDHVRSGLNSNLGFSEEDRLENLRRVAEVAKLFCDTGLIVVTAFISPTDEARKRAKEIIGEEDYIEVYIDTHIDICEKRDVKGLYKKARAGTIKDFTGVSSPFDIPQNAHLCIKTDGVPVEKCVDQIIDLLLEKKIISKKLYSRVGV